ncbi:MAG: hypothetical protein CM1200mP20_17310 [Pseudomonadota bacterium]|nr:MAG: hypothetical protein CM1200mP20_17310 [Pseudomonadota bacterium]
MFRDGMLRLKVFDLLTGQHPSVVVFMTGQRQAVALDGVGKETGGLIILYLFKASRCSAYNDHRDWS